MNLIVCWQTNVQKIVPVDSVINHILSQPSCQWFTSILLMFALILLTYEAVIQTCLNLPILGQIRLNLFPSISWLFVFPLVRDLWIDLSGICPQKSSVTEAKEMLKTKILNTHWRSINNKNAKEPKYWIWPRAWHFEGKDHRNNQEGAFEGSRTMYMS